MMKTLTELENLFGGWICTATGVPADHVMISFQQYGRPAFSPADDVIFFSIMPQIDIAEQYKSIALEYDAASGQFDYTQCSQRTLHLDVIAYGTGGYNNLLMLSNWFYSPDAQIELKNNGLSFVPDHIYGVTRTYEEYNGQWWERADLRERFYCAANIEMKINKFDSFDIRTEVD